MEMLMNSLIFGLGYDLCSPYIELETERYVRERIAEQLGINKNGTGQSSTDSTGNQSSS